MKTNRAAPARYVTRPLALLALLLAVLQPLSAEEPRAPFKLTAEDVRDGAAWLDESAWAYRLGDDPAWAADDFDDSAWATEGFDELVFQTRTSPAGDVWDGAAWFRLRLQVDDALVNRPLALRVRHWGASEIYLDGKLLRRFGVIGAARDVEENPRALPMPFVFTEGGEHTIAIRYSYKAARDTSSGMGRWLMHAHLPPGFSAFIQPAEVAAANYGRSSRESRTNWLFVGVLVTLALLHFLLYAFYRRERANLFYSFFVLSLAANILLMNSFSGDTPTGARSAFGAALGFVVSVATYAVAFTSLLAFLHVAFAEKLTKRFYALLALWLVLIATTAVYVRSDITLYFACLCLALTLVEGIRIMVRALVRGQAGSWIIAAGLALFAAAMCAVMARELELYRMPAFLRTLTDLFILLAVPVSVSVFLARNFARTNRDLEAQLVNVQDLSARQLEHERAAAELRIKHEQERAENERRAKELEEARALQLSMLPREVPRHPHLDVAAYMKPATEVGGDYYDFHVAQDGTLTVVVGDATGHGLKAGTVVTATKSLFNAYAAEPDIRTFFRQSSRALKAMNLRGLFMAMVMLKIEGHSIRASAAGMPPLLVYRAGTGEVEEVLIKGMPLGSVSSFPYKQIELSLAPGDTVVLMSDGFPERFNEAGEMLDYDRARGVLAEVARLAPAEIIERFVREGERWAGGRPQDDDVTFVVLKVKELKSDK
ncbi:MAG: SpoIIE family protein phosphatase [Pyrinomonadaceae bacterium]